MARIGPEEYEHLLALVGRYYDVILPDLGTGIVDPGAKFGIQRADRAIVVTTPEYVTVEKVLDAATYSLEALRLSHRGATKELAVEIAEALV